MWQRMLAKGPAKFSGKVPSTEFRDPDAWDSGVGLKLSRRMTWVWGWCRRRGLRNKASMAGEKPTSGPFTWPPVVFT